MNFFIYVFVLLIFSLAPLSAQTPSPARPVDPTQAMPAQPVDSKPAAPAVPATPADSSSSATNAPSAPAPAPDIAVAIIADGSLKQVLQELAQSWADTLDSSPQVPLTLTNAGTMLTKIEGGSTWDVVIGADVQDMKELTTKGLLLAEGQRSLARNELVVYGRKALVKDDDLDWFDLVGTEWKKVAMGNPDLVASGRVADRALRKHDLVNDDNKDTYVRVANESLALAVASREQADAVFAYKTDLAQFDLPGFTLFPIKTEDAPPIFYTAAVCRAAKNSLQAHAFIDYCSSEAAKPIWAKYGFETN